MSVRACVRPSVPSCFWLKKRRFVIEISLKKDVIFGCPAEIHKSALKNAQQSGDLVRKRLIFGEVCCLMGEMSEGMGWDKAEVPTTGRRKGNSQSYSASQARGL